MRNERKFNLTEFFIMLTGVGWYSRDMKFIPDEWNVFEYYKSSLITISIKVIGRDFIIRKDFDNKRIFKVNWDDMFDFLCEGLHPSVMLINKAKQYQQKLNDILSDFEE